MRKPMKHFYISLVTFFVTYISASSQSLPDSQSIYNIRNSIREQYTDWAIFSNGTYIVITADSATPNLDMKIREILKSYGKFEGKVLNKSTLVLKIEGINGWVVDGRFQGVYTYVSEREMSALGKDNPTTESIISYAMQKRIRDIGDLRIIVKPY